MARAAIETARKPPLQRVINATGVILQTNLGRAPLSGAARRAIENAAIGYTNLEYDLEKGARGSRHEHLRDLLRRTTGAEDGLVTNNNASALLMVLQVLAKDREVLLSRGHAVEIGGGFRIPDVMRQSGARLVDVGTTNRTYASDYDGAVSSDTALIMHVHSSNFRVVGFTAEPSIEELAVIAKKHGLNVVADQGSGCLLDTTKFGMAEEPTVQDSVASGSDLTLFSGDKLLGGPQAGIIVGRSELIDSLRRHPLARALRVDKLTIAALAATLQSYADGRAHEEIPVWQMISTPANEIRARAQSWAGQITGSVATESRTMVGGGSLPGEGLPTWCLSIGPPADATKMAVRLRELETPILARIEQDELILDPRCVEPEADDQVISAVSHVLEGDC